MELVRPEKQVAARHEHTVNAAQELLDLGFRHLPQLGSRPLTRTLVAVALMVEDAPVLRIENAEWEAVRLKLAQERQAVAVVAMIKLEIVRHRDIGLDDIPPTAKYCFIAVWLHDGSYTIVEAGVNRFKKVWLTPHVPMLRR